MGLGRVGLIMIKIHYMKYMIKLDQVRYDQVSLQKDECKTDLQHLYSQRIRGM